MRVLLRSTAATVCVVSGLICGEDLSQNSCSESARNADLGCTSHVLRGKETVFHLPVSGLIVHGTCHEKAVPAAVTLPALRWQSLVLDEVLGREALPPCFLSP
jgi:hypothetical protein